MDRQTPSLARTAWTGRLLGLQAAMRILEPLDHRRWSVGSFADEFEAVRAGGPEGVARFAASIDPEWISEALKATGKASVRTRKFPAEMAIWLVIALGLFEDRSIAEVVDHLGLVVPGVRSLTPSAVAQARYRVGPDPLRWLFLTAAQEWADEPEQGAWRGLALYGVDGTHLRLPDTDGNFEAFGMPGGRNGPGDAGYPQVRLVCLLNLSTRLLVDAEMGPWRASEHELASDLWSVIPEDSLTLLDRGFVNYAAYLRVTQGARNRNLLGRMKSNQKFELLETLSDGTLLGRFTLSAAARKSNPDLPEQFVARVIEYQNERGEEGRLLTTLLDPELWPADELVELYHQRWELEVAFDELKTHMLERKEALRSLKPDGIRQEVWGLLLTYNLVRREMALAAKEFKLPANRIAFVPALHWIRAFWLTGWRTAPATLPLHLGKLRSSLRLLVLPPRRPLRRYPRQVKIKMSNYPRNRGGRGSGKRSKNIGDLPK